ncbi:restriction endonuclease subunit S [Atribacter laminatus]|uniref:Type I restriction modification DNA specificity domain-containing protein n=1 Tax=Atribacter laminatus TaxID=2847778 RepID=A0A7T1F3Q5_ATRLM|nr:restriction endonuclease subunit S [Atribacter laminatus]QPM68611.1 hypothetical protein RT761_01833 [Atribacter laminatus]
MGSEWQEVSLGDIFKVKHGFAFKGQFFTDTRTSTILVTPGNFAIGGGFQNPKPKYYKGEISEEYILKPGQVIVTMTDLSKEADTLGYAAIVPDDGNIWLHNQRIGLLEFKDSFPTDSVFINYLLRTNEYRSWIIGSASGTTVKHTSPSRIHAFKCKIPPINEQRAIAHILGSLDDKIELNRRMNKTLEAIARAIFKSWFIDFDPVIDNALQAGNPIPDSMAERAEMRRQILDQNQPSSSSFISQRAKNRKYSGGFDFSGLGEISIDEIYGLFPDSFQDSELGPIPKGWEVVPLSEFLNIIGGGTPKTKVKEYWGGNIPWFSVIDAPSETDVFVIDTEKHITQLGVERSSTKVLRKGTTIISARGTVGKCALLGRPMAMNQSCYGIQGKNGESDYFVYFVIKRQVSDLQRSGHGSVFNTIIRDTFRTIRIILPPTKLTILLEDTVHELMELMLSNLFENLTLASLRDILLPKLISGELRVPDAEKFVEEAGV